VRCYTINREADSGQDRGSLRGRKVGEKSNASEGTRRREEDKGKVGGGRTERWGRGGGSEWESGGDDSKQSYAPVLS